MSEQYSPTGALLLALYKHHRTPEAERSTSWQTSLEAMHHKLDRLAKAQDVDSTAGIKGDVKRWALEVGNMHSMPPQDHKLIEESIGKIPDLSIAAFANQISHVDGYIAQRIGTKWPTASVSNASLGSNVLNVTAGRTH